jgi:carboxyl-terminal processing protease
MTISKIVAFLFIALLVSSCATTTTTTATTTTTSDTEELLSPELRALNVESFDAAWATIRENHWDREKTEEEWSGLYDAYQPRIVEAETHGAYLSVLRELINGFEQSHFSIMSSDVYESIVESVDAAEGAEAGDSNGDAAESGGSDSEESAAGGVGISGMDVRVLDGRVVVTNVQPDSSAARMGVKLGWEVLTVDGDTLNDTLSEINDSFKEKPVLEMTLHRAALNWIEGDAGTSKTIEFNDRTESGHTLTVTMSKPEGTPYRLGVFPPTFVTVKTERLTPDVGYFGFSLFLDPLRVMQSFEKALDSFRECDGIIIDVRGNGGGLPLVAMGIAGWLSEEKKHILGTMITKDTELKLVINPRLNPYRGKVAVLIDGSSASASEMFAAGLRDIGRARIFGTRTAGAVLPASFKRLPNGDFFYYPIANYVSSNGDRLEGVGVFPDEHNPHTQTDLLNGRDNALEAARHWIEND